MATKQQTLLMITLVGLAFAVSTMTAFRLESAPLGLSEFILLSCMLVHIPLGHGIHGGNVPNRFVPFLFLFVLATLPGYAMTLVSEGGIAGAGYNLLAMLYVVLLFAYLHYGFDHQVVGLDRLVQFFLAFSTVYFLVVLALIFLDPSTVFVQDEAAELLSEQSVVNSAEATEPVVRLYGFATNPNQLGLHALVCCFFALQLRKRNGFLVTAICLATAVAIGLLCKSDAFLFALVALVGLSIFMGVIFRGSVVGSLVIIVPSIVIGLALLGPAVDVIQDIASTNDQNSIRFTLWKNGLDAGLTSPLFGLGPGAWSGYDGPMGDEEAHNSAIDYFSMAGVLGLTLLFWGMSSLTLRTILSKDSVLFGGLIAVFLFAAFHNVLRQPILWLTVYYIAQNVFAKATAPTRRRRSKKTMHPSSGRSRRRNPALVSER